MKAGEIEQILINSLLHTINTRADFYKNEALKKGVSLSVFANELIEAYKRIEKYVNQYETDICIDDNGNEYRQKKAIISGQIQIDAENVNDLLLGIKQFVNNIITDQQTENKETVISKYLASTERILQCFGFNIMPNKQDVLTVTKVHDFYNALRELYLSDSKEKDNYYKLIFEVINKANYHIDKDNFEGKSYNDVWRAIDHALTLANSYISELHLKETDNYFPNISQPQPDEKKEDESPFSAIVWATIFYYADETKLLSDSSLLKTRMEQFMSKHKLNTTFKNLRAKYYDAKKRINEKSDYPVNKLELILPFIKENYKLAINKVKNDITYLKENTPEY